MNDLDQLLGQTLNNATQTLRQCQDISLVKQILKEIVNIITKEPSELLLASNSL